MGHPELHIREYAIFRGELAKIFIDPVKERVKFIFDETVERWERYDDGIVVSFAKSKETKKYDLLVAADGLGSKLRGILRYRSRSTTRTFMSHTLSLSAICYRVVASPRELT